MKTSRAICLHVERLHDDEVWQRLVSALDELAARDVKITFLVYPFRSVAQGRDIKSRVSELSRRGHEIGQHTHFYLGQATERPHKRTDLSDANVRECILRDYAWLTDCGVQPRGFCGGNFMMTETAYQTLTELNFVYDCSARLPWERNSFEIPSPWLNGAKIRDFNGRPLVLLANTEYLTLTQLLHPRRRNRSASLLNGSHNYQLLMNHDSDLLHWKVWYGFLGQLRRKPELRTVGQLAELCLAQRHGS